MFLLGTKINHQFFFNSQSNKLINHKTYEKKQFQNTYDE